MDDSGNEIVFDDETRFQLTPKGFLMRQFEALGATHEAASDGWFRFEAFCVKRAAVSDNNAGFAALVFDGEGGSVIGLDLIEGKSDE